MESKQTHKLEDVPEDQETKNVVHDEIEEGTIIFPKDTMCKVYKNGEWYFRVHVGDGNYEEITIEKLKEGLLELDPDMYNRPEKVKVKLLVADE